MAQKVQCPVCTKELDINFINKHLDTCSKDKDPNGPATPKPITVTENDDDLQDVVVITDVQSKVSDNPSSKLSNLLNGNAAKKRQGGSNGTAAGIKKKESTYRFQGFGKSASTSTSGGSQSQSSTPSLKRNSSSAIDLEVEGDGEENESAMFSTQETNRNNSHSDNIKRPKFEGSSSPPRQIEKSARELEMEEESKRKLKDLEEIRLLRLQSRLPLAERLRPSTLDEYVGQQHLIGKGGILRGFIEHDRIPSIILWGPPGVGKTSLARIISHTTNCRFVELKATLSGTADCKRVFEEAKNELRLTKRKTVLFCDEIHRFNKAQQDIFLPYVEDGLITLIGATTENPSFQLNSALLSRCRVFVLTKLEVPELTKVILKALLLVNKIRKLIHHKPILRFTKEAVGYICDIADGDSRSALNLLDLSDSHFMTNLDDDDKRDPSTVKFIDVTPDKLREILQRTHMVYDRVGDAHYDTISAFHKSVRGNNPDAALYYLARMLKGGESPLYIARRMIRIASEDVGLLDDSCLPFAVAAYQAVQFVGMPEADLALVHCAVKLANAKKSVQIYRCWNELNAKLDHEPNYAGAPIPMHLRNAPTKLMSELGYSENYKYPPNFKDGKVKQEYFPQALKGYRVLDGKHLGDSIDPDL